MKLNSHFDKNSGMEISDNIEYGFISEANFPSSYIEVNTTTYLLTRDEDFDNSFHTVADFMNIFLVNKILNINSKKQQLLILDR